MLPLLTASQIRDADAYTIARQNIASIDLMERASAAFVKLFTDRYSNRQQAILVFCGTGNNGGDGLAIARLLFHAGYAKVAAIIARFNDKRSADFDINLERLQQLSIPVEELHSTNHIAIEPGTLVIDALLGSGLNKTLSGNYQVLVNYLNSLDNIIVAVDVPTGFFTEGELPADATVLIADLVITFQQPKINFLLPESGKYIREWVVAKIGLDKTFMDAIQSPYQWVEDTDITERMRARRPFSNKGTFGHALVVAGQAETMGAALLCSSACVYAGAGLTTACIPESGLIALNSYQPEVMALIRKRNESTGIDWEKFNAIAIGPGLGKGRDALELLEKITTNYTKPLVIDADALNLLAEHPQFLEQLPPGSILTPHMKEFDRLFGDHNNWWQRLQTLRLKAQELNLNIILKNDYTITGTVGGKLYFNSTSNAAMATGGMGDVLTGILTALLAQKYEPDTACLLAVYLHGKAGDELALPGKRIVVLPGQVAAQIPVTMADLIKQKNS